jgi:glycosyltransferase involved in cell wall biosynthesis
MKKRILFSSNYCGIKTGFGGFMREILTELYKTGKYELALYAGGTVAGNPEFKKWPWKVYGCLPNDKAKMDEIQKDPNLARIANYGDILIDEVMKDFKPDIFFGVEDVWGVDFFKNKKWWNKIPCVVHTTLDSRPILNQAVELAKKTPYFYCWADFATKDLNEMGLSHVKTMRGTVNTNVYKKLPFYKRQELRQKFKIPQNTFCIGMLSRNQLRKSFPNLIEGYKLFKKSNPSIDSRLLFFTHFGEGWNIKKLCKEYGVDENEVLATYKCRATGEYFVMPFTEQNLDNPVSGHQKSLITVNITDGLTDEQVNEWYNLLDVYVHAFTSGGQERSIQEAKLCELTTLVTNYSCGEDCCVPEAGSLPLEYAEYREHQTEFIKASTYPHSISRQLTKFYSMPKKQKEENGRKARQWVLDNFSVEVIGKQIQELIDSLPVTNHDFETVEERKDEAAFVPDVPDNKEWLKLLYKAVLKMDVDDNDDGLNHWLKQFSNGRTRAEINNYFRSVAKQENEKQQDTRSWKKLLGPENYKDRVLINIPESLGDCIYVSSLLRDARLQYPNKKIYLATKPQFQAVFEHLVGDQIDAILDWQPEFDQSMALEYTDSPTFNIVLQTHFFTQRMINYLHNGEDSSSINLNLE